MRIEVHSDNALPTNESITNALNKYATYRRERKTDMLRREDPCARRY